MKIVGQLSYNRGPQIGIGQGLNSEVYRISEPQLGGEMVAKEIPKASFGDPSEYFEEAQRAFASMHPNVVPIQYACDAGSHIALVMQFFRNGSLADRIVAGPLPEREVIRIGLSVLNGLAHIHAKQLTHFDVKPSNVLFNDSDEPMVADFGQARPHGPLGIATAPPMYPHAVTPEVYLGNRGWSASDVYQVGLLLYRAVNGEPHYARQVPSDDAECKRQTLKEKFPDRKRFMPHVSSHLRRVIRRALKVSTAKRFATASEMATALGRVAVASDWHVSISASETIWEWDKSPAPSNRVVLRDSITGFEVNAYTHSAAGGARRKDPVKFGRKALSANAAWKHLNDVVFPGLR